MSVSPCDDWHFHTFSVKLPHLQLHSERSDSDVLHFVLLISELCPLCSFAVGTLHAGCVFWMWSIVTILWWTVGRWAEFNFLLWAHFLLKLRKAEEPTPPSLQWVPGLNLLGHEADHWPPSSAEAFMVWTGITFGGGGMCGYISHSILTFPFHPIFFIYIYIFTCSSTVQNLLSSSLLSENMKIQVYRTVIFPVVCGCETCCWHWGRNIGWGCLRIGCLGEHLGLRGAR